MEARSEADWRGPITEALRNHLGTVLTTSYVVLTAAGITYEFFLFFDFHVNILDYAEVGDFLTAALRTPMLIVFTLLPVPLLLLLHAGDRWLSRRWRRYGEYLQRQRTPRNQALQRYLVSPLFVLVYFVAFTVNYASSASDRIRSGTGRSATVVLAPGLSAADTLAGTVVGSNAKFVFLYAPSDTSMHVIPVESIREIRHSAARRGHRRAAVAPAPDG